MAYLICEVIFAGLANIIRDGLTPKSKTFFISAYRKKNYEFWIITQVFIYKNILTLEAQSKFIPNAASVSSTRELSLHFTAEINNKKILIQ